MPQKEQYIDQVINVIEMLPPLPDSILSLQMAVQEKDINFARITEIIKKDSALTADILNIANSALFARGTPVESPKTAIRNIGLSTITNFVTLQFSTRVLKERFSSIEGLQEYFQHATDVAETTQLLAQNTGKSRVEQEKLYTAGLLHDIGRLVLIMAVEPQIIQDLSLNDWYNIDHTAAIEEKEILGINHCIAGQHIAEKWHFSEDTQHIILNHHTPLQNGIDYDSSYVFMAHFLLMKEFTTQKLIQIFPHEVLEKMHFTEECIEKTRTELQR
ncbi:HDOD domain-containing protein [Chitinivibrio alkaliphilus]|uniref:Metal dependent phosphohydrolase n=1 Tax=Chitinivibrio alkaliphilus ACht1 TaxID=1313304 RepID=U7D7U3_9BACT|nr:HDOD domain-containing protein [Chitinivibrio alkaliphilus]ERP32008.1 metal dependent phosphohydrolase [Chitinivibrio alkaliphilus ACht1]